MRIILFLISITIFSGNQYLEMDFFQRAGLVNGFFVPKNTDSSEKRYEYEEKYEKQKAIHNLSIALVYTFYVFLAS